MAEVLKDAESTGQRIPNSELGRASGWGLSPETVKALDVKRYVGRWYQVLCRLESSSLSSMLLEVVC